MPRKNVPKVKKSKKYVRKSKKSYTRSTFKPQRLLTVGFPKTTMVKLRYVDYATLNPGIYTVGTAIFKANGCYDPNTSGTGHQPMGFDQWASFYNHYIVVGAKITAVLNTSSTVYSGCIFGINLNDDLTMSTDIGTVMEQGLSKFKMANFNTTSGSGNGIRVSKGFSCKKFFQVTNPLDSLSRLGALTTADPTDTANFIVFFGAPPGDGNDFASINATVTIEYIVIFSEPKDLPQS